MGGIFSNNRNSEGVERLEYSDNNAYKYPPKGGSYFGSHFFMGGERFDATQPEAFLFGENADLNYLGSRPHPFPYHVTVGSEPSKALRGFVNIRKDSLKLVKIEEDEVDDEECPRTKYLLEFIVDADLPCSITIHMFAREEISGGVLSYVPSDSNLSSPVYHVAAGYKQVFRKEDYCISPCDFKDDELSYTCGGGIIPLVIHCCIEKNHLPINEDFGDANSGLHGQVTLLSLERSGESSFFSLRFLKQKQIIDGLPYLLQEIYGLEEFARSLKEDTCTDGNDLDGESTTDCVVCMSEIRDTLILPCRHMCLCSTCAESLRYQASACPICRAPFRALLQIRGLRRVIPLSAGLTPALTAQQQAMAADNLQLDGNLASEETEANEDEEDDNEGPSQSPSTPNRELSFDARTCCSPLPLKPAPPGYEAVPLMELLSTSWLFPYPQPRSNPFTMAPDGESTHLDQLLGRSQAFIRRSHSGYTSGDGASVRSATFLRNNSLRRSTEPDPCNVSIESGSLRSRSSKKKGNKKRNKPNHISAIPIADSAKATAAASMLSPRNVDVAISGATGASSLPDDCEVIELTPASRSTSEDPAMEPLKLNLDEEKDGFQSVELRAPGEKNSVSVDLENLESTPDDAPMEISPSSNGVLQSEEDSSLSSTTSGRALLGPKYK